MHTTPRSAGLFLPGLLLSGCGSDAAGTRSSSAPELTFPGRSEHAPPSLTGRIALLDPKTACTIDSYMIWKLE